jgi:hypothetical protein
MSESSTHWRPVFRRALMAMAAWMLVGIFCGLLQRDRVGDHLIAAVSSMIAGGIIYGMLGTIAGLIQARGHDVLVGAAFGFFMGLLAQSVETASLVLPTDGLTTTIGALIMTTARPFVSAILAIRIPLLRFLRGVEQQPG